MFRVGDGAHAMHPRSRSIGKATAWAVYRGPWVWPAEARNLRPRRGAPPPHASGDAWKAEGEVAYGGNLGPGATINSGEVAAAIAAVREAVYVRRTRAKQGRYFNILYAIDSSSCADEMDKLWRAGNLSGVSDSTIAPLVETWVHCRRELDSLGGILEAL